jgi:SAM-dependent methyltransferase
MTTLTENAIRPRTLMTGLAGEVEADRRWLIERRNRFVAVDCPVCQSVGQPAFSKLDFEYQRCPACRTVFMNPRPPESLLHEFYNQSRTYAYWNKHVFPASEDARRKSIFVPRAERVIEFCHRYCSKPGTLLEIGAGFGTFCEEIQSRNLFEKVIALEMTPDLAASCVRRGLTVIQDPIESLTLPAGSIDVIAAFETLEHLFSPRNFLTTIHEMLADNGLVVITCPSIDGFDVVTLQTDSDTIDHEHVNYLNPNSIRQLATECGFEVLEVSTPGRLDADIVRNKVLDGVISLADQPWLKQVLIDQWETLGRPFQDFLAMNQLSSHMWMVATKRASSSVE